MRFFDFQIFYGNEDHQKCGDGDDKLHENRKRVHRKSSAKTNERQPAGKRPPEQDELKNGKAQADESENSIPEFIAFVLKKYGVNNQDRQSENRKKDFRFDGKVIERLKKNIPNVCH